MRVGTFGIPLDSRNHEYSCPLMFVKFAILTAIISVICGAWRVAQFGQIELLSDQAFFTQWILSLANADHFFPKGDDGQGFFTSLIRDEDSFLNIFIRQIYQAQALLFISLSTLIFTLGVFLAGVSMEGVITVSIAASAVALWMLALFPVLSRVKHPSDTGAMESYAVGVLVLLIGCTNSFLNIFSAMGPHNTGILFLLLAALVTQRWLNRVSESGILFADRTLTFWMFTVQILAIYSHYTNVFIIAPATVIAIVLNPSLRPWRRRLALIAKYSGIILLAFVPAMALIVLHNSVSGNIANDQTFAEVALEFVFRSEDDHMAAIADRVVRWFRHVTTYYSSPGMLLGLIGLVGIAWRDRLFLPAAIVITHFLVGAVMPAFGQYDRTAAYLVPMLLLGGAWLIVAAMCYLAAHRRSGLMRTTVVSALVIGVLATMTKHLVTEYTRIENPSTVPDWGRFLGGAAWRPVISELDASLPINSLLIPWDYGLSHQFKSMSARSGINVRVFRPLETFVSHQDAGTLSKYINFRGLTLSSDQTIYLLGPGAIGQTQLEKKLQGVFGQDGFALSEQPMLVPVFSWKLPEVSYLASDLRLYEIVWR